MTTRSSSRRDFIIASTATMLTLGACGAGARAALKATAPWAGQFLLGVGVNVAGESIIRLFDQANDEELALLEPASAQLDRGRFTVPVSERYHTGDGISDVYRDDTRLAFCRIDPGNDHETCLALCDIDQGAWVAVEGPALAALHSTNNVLRDEGFTNAEIDRLTTPVELEEEVVGEEFRFESDIAVRRYRTAEGSITITWTTTTGDLGDARVEIPAIGGGVDVSGIRPRGEHL